MFFDTHAHLDLPPLAGTEDAVLRRAREAGVTGSTTIGLDPDSSAEAVAIAHRHAGVYAAVGLHPHDASRAKAKKFLTDIGTTLGTFGRHLQSDIQRYVPDLWDEIEEFRRQQILDKLDRMFRQGIRENIFRRDLNPEIFTLVFIGAVQAIINPTVLSNRSFSATEAFSAILGILFEGALSDGARQSVQMFDPPLPTSS